MIDEEQKRAWEHGLPGYLQRDLDAFKEGRAAGSSLAELSRFYGLIIKMFFRQSEHNPPHVHVEYGEFVGMIDIQTFEMIEGDLPRRALDMVQEWCGLHKDELMTIWKTQNFVKIAPLD